MEEIRTVIRDQGVRNTQLLDVMGKQQNRAQTAATAAMTAQNDALNHFKDPIASIVVPLSQRPPTAVHLPEKDRKFPDWDGDRTCYYGYSKSIKSGKPKKSRTPWQLRFARHAMGVAAYWHFKEVPQNWAAFVKVLEHRFMPSDMKND